MSRFLITAITLSSTIMLTFGQNAIGASCVDSTDCANYCLGQRHIEGKKCCANTVVYSSTLMSSCAGCGGDGMCNLCDTDAYKLNSAETKCETKIKAIGESCALLMDCRFSCKGPTGAKKCCAFQLQYNSLCGGCGTDGMCNFCKARNTDTEAYKLNSLKTECVKKDLPKGDACKSPRWCESNKCSGYLEENPSDKLHCCDSTVNDCDGCGSDGMW